MTTHLSSAAAAHEVLLLTGICKSYPGVQAVRDVAFSVRPGEIHALVGENGAGKSTLMGVAAGMIRPDRGTVVIAGERLRVASPKAARNHGLSMAYQDDSLIPDLSVAENLALSAASEAARSEHTNEWARDLLSVFRSSVDPRTPARELSFATRQIVEIVKALASSPSVLLLDEPTAALPSNEVDRLHALLRERAETGVAIVYITHRLHEVMSLSHRVSVMRDGIMARADVDTTVTTENELVTLMIGRSLDTVFPAKHPQSNGDLDESSVPVLEISALASARFQNVSFEVRKGEVVGLAGVEGNGQHEVMRAIAGLAARTGKVSVRGTPVGSHNVEDARRKGIVYISGDRRSESLFPTLSVRENLAAGNLRHLSVGGVLSLRRERRTVAATIKSLNIRVTDMHQNVTDLSGGNQQKVALGGAFISAPDVFLVEEPTQGVDAGARAEIYRLLRAAAARGNGVVVLSSDAVELAGLCDRVLVFVRGRVAREFHGDRVKEDAIVEAAVTTGGSSAIQADNRATPEIGTRGEKFLNWSRRSDFAPVVLLLVAMVAIAAGVALSQPLFLSRENFGNLFFLAVPLAFAALGQASVMLVGGIDLSIGPLIALSTVAIAQIMHAEGGGARDSAAIASALVIGLAVGILNAFLIRTARLAPLIATLATYILLQGVALVWLPVPGGYISNLLLVDATSRWGFIPWSFVALIVAGVALELVYRRTKAGLWFRAVGSRPIAARRMGARSNTIHYAAYIVSGLFGAVAGIFLASTIGIGDPTLGVTFTLASISAVVLGGLSTWGGRGSLMGPILGAVLLAEIANASSFLNLPSHTQLFVQGGLLLFAIGLYSRLRASGTQQDELLAR